MRHEIKYIVPIEKLDLLREMIQPFVTLDPHVKKRGHSQYTVRSIYFDSPDNLFYREKVEGVPYRLKLRIRGYNDPSLGAPVFFEIKRKHRVPMTKDRVAFDFSTVLDILNNGLDENSHLSGQREERISNLRKFLYHYNRLHLHPVVLVVYDREPFESLYDDSIRITFDKSLRSKALPNIEELYSNELTPVMTRFFILEVKYNNQYPGWMEKVANSFDLKQQAASKYCMSMDNHPELLKPGTWRNWQPIEYISNRA